MYKIIHQYFYIIHCLLLTETMNFMCENVTLCFYKYNIILLNKKNNIIHRLLLAETKNFVFTKSDNKYFYYTRRRIIKYLFLLYKTMYNRNKYFYYTRRCIIKIFISIIQDDV